MTTVSAPHLKKSLKSDVEISQFLKENGVLFKRWPTPAEVKPLLGKGTLTPEEQQQVLKAYKPQLDKERVERGYVQADIVVLSAQTPNLETMLAKFDKTHFHDDDEVRFIIDGEGVFGFEPEGKPAYSITVTTGDYIIVPAKTWHWFTLTSPKSIKAMRLFKDMSGWTPHYKNAPK